MSHIQYLDDLVKEYLLFRGFTHTLRTLDNEIKIDKDKGFRVSDARKGVSVRIEREKSAVSVCLV